MREIDVKQITDVVEKLCIEANEHLPEDVKCAIKNCRACEDGEIAKGVLDNIIENFEIADKADSLVSVAINTLNIQKSFNVGESYQAELWVQRGGLSDMSGKVKFMIDPNLLDSLNRGRPCIYSF